MSDLVKATLSSGAPRFALAVLFGSAIPVNFRTFDFWPIGVADEWRSVVESFGILVQLITVVALFIWMVGASVEIFRRRFSRAVINIIAIFVVPACSAILLATPLTDPWVWYVIANKSSLEASAVHGASQAGGVFVVVEERDISMGIAGLSENHFVELIFSERDPNEVTSSVPELTHIYGNFYRRDKFI